MKNKKFDRIFDLVLKGIALAMGVAVIVLTLLDALDTKSLFLMVGIGLSCVGLVLLDSKNDKKD